MEKNILELNEIAKQQGKKFKRKRFIYDKIKKSLNKKIFLAIIGPRGAGKTVLLKQFCNLLENSFYISLDSILLDRPLFEICKELEQTGIKYLFIDEIHFLNNFQKELKKIYDFLNIQIIFTGSVSIPLYRSAYDLSRRVKVFHLYPFSFDEFLFFKDKKVQKFVFSDFSDLIKSKKYYGKILQFESLFEEYLKGALFPFTLDSMVDNSIFLNILNTVLRKDLIQSGEVDLSEIEEIQKTLKFIGFSPAEDINYSSISSNVGITKYKAEKYVLLLEKAFLLNVVMPKGTNIKKEPKILLNLPYRLLYKSFEQCIGDLREDFFVELSKMYGLDLRYLKSLRGEKTPDYFLPKQDIVFEIGGKGKSINQFKGFNSKKKLILTHPGRISEFYRPLFMYGMLEM